MAKDISVNVGNGVPKVDIAFDQEEELENIPQQDDSFPEKPQPIIHTELNDRFIYNSVGQKTHYNKAFFKGQSRHHGMFKLGHPKAKLFKLSEEKDVEEYNKLLAQIGSEGEDPQITNLTLDKQFHEGSYVILATYNEIWYILPEQK